MLVNTPFTAVDQNEMNNVGLSGSEAFRRND
jgi:hypothetical protein